MKSTVGFAFTASAVLLFAGCSAFQQGQRYGQLPTGNADALPQSSSSYEVLHRFGRHAKTIHDRGGANLLGGLLNVGGTLYGTTEDGGSSNAGAVFTITTTGEEKTLYRFTAGGANGSDPEGGLIDVNGTLYGTTSSGGG